MADVYLADRTRRRTVAGAQLTQLAGRRGLCTALPTAASAIQLSSAAEMVRSSALVIYGFLTNPGDVDVRCRSGGQPERTHNVMKL